MGCGCEERKIILQKFCDRGGHVYLALGVAGFLSLYLIYIGSPGTLWLALIAILVFGAFVAQRERDCVNA